MWIKKAVDMIKGLEKPDVAIINGHLVDVVTGSIVRVNVYVKENRVVFLSEHRYERLENDALVIDASGMYIAPGFIDSHAHVESSLVIPSLFGHLLLKEGVTTSIVDLHEVANVAGDEGIKAMIRDMEISPLKFVIQVPSCVPPDPELETSGGTLNSEKVEVILEELNESNLVVGLGEMMSYKRLLEYDRGLLRKLGRAYEMGLVINGHTADMEGPELQAYAVFKVATDHCARGGEEVMERLRSGLYVQIQKRSCESCFREIVNVLKSLPTTHRVMWCTDDAEADEIWLGTYTVRSIVKEAIELSLDPIKAIQMATINAAQAYRIDSEVGLIAPGRYADMIILRSLERVNIESVLANGKVVFHRGRYLVELPKPHQDLERFNGNTLSVGSELKPIDLVPRAEIESGSAVVNILTVEKTVTSDILPIKEGVITCDPSKDIAWISVINRYGKGYISRGFVKGTGIREGAFSSSVSHDTHNIVVIGTDINDMYTSLAEILKSGGGIAFVSKGNLVSKIELPYFGLMSSDPALPTRLADFKKKLLANGIKVPLKKLMFLTLTVGRGGYAITDKGLVDYKAKKTLPTLVEYVSR
ncbi:MAG: adenine deaminase C-terminal domain-containing protein [Thermofilaceae archaeon]